jgi:hypothetical protein
MSRAGLLPAALAFVTGCGGCTGSTTPAATAPASDAGQVSDARADAPSSADVHAEAPADAGRDVQAPTGKPVWEDLPTQVVGCTVQRLANASSLRLFNWATCAMLPKCEEAIFHPSLITPTTILSPLSKVIDDGTGTRVLVDFYTDPTAVSGDLIADEDGQVLAGFRCVNPQCLVGGTIGRSRFGIEVTGALDDASIGPMGGLLGSVDHPSDLVGYVIDPVPVGWPDEVVMGDHRLLRRWYPDQLGTLSNVDGSGFTIFTKLSQSILSLDWVSTTGPSFLFDVIEFGDGGVERYIARSDGVAAPTRFISASPGIWVGASGFANSFLVWQRGLNPQDVNRFDSVELWASPYTEDPAQLAPFKVDDLGGHSLFPGAAGWGRYALAVPELPTQHTTIVWDLATKTKREITLPPDRYIGSWPGLTRTHLWLLAHETTSTRTPLMRFQLAP